MVTVCDNQRTPGHQVPLYQDQGRHGFALAYFLQIVRDMSFVGSVARITGWRAATIKQKGPLEQPFRLPVEGFVARTFPNLRLQYPLRGRPRQCPGAS
jgi:hypothetical protein